MNWHKLVIAACTGVLISSAAVAQPSVAARYVGEFSGFYVGVNGGGMDFTTSGYNVLVPTIPWGTDRQSTGIGGIHGGYQVQWGNFVLGVEGAWDAAFGSSFGSRAGALVGNPCDAGLGFECQARINDILQVGPRVGFAMGNWMIYGTGGYARAEIESRYLVIPTGLPLGLQPSIHHDGWYYGGGLEMLATNNFVIGVEYKHFDFKSAVQVDTGGDSINLKAKADAVLLRLTIKQ
jgi:outer membrane immunogenic protein